MGMKSTDLQFDGKEVEPLRRILYNQMKYFKIVTAAILAAGFAARVHGQTFAFSGVDPYTGLYQYTDAIGKSIYSEKKEDSISLQQAGSPASTYSGQITTEEGRLANLIYNINVGFTNGSNPDYDLGIKILKNELKGINFSAKSSNENDYLRLDLGAKLLALLGTAYNKTGQESKTIDDLLVISKFDTKLFDKDSEDVISIYSRITEAYYSLAQKAPKGSDAQMQLYKDCGKFGYEMPCKAFGEDTWLGKMTKNDQMYLEDVASAHYKLDFPKDSRLKIFAKLIQLFPGESDYIENYNIIANIY